MRSSQIHQLALAGLLYGIDHFIISEKKNNDDTNYLTEKVPLFEKISPYISDKEKDTIGKITGILEKIPQFRRSSLSSVEKHDFSILDKLEEKWEFLTSEEIDNFFLNVKAHFLSSGFLPHCQVLSALLACGEYPFLCGGKISDRTKSHSSPVEGEILTGRLLYRYIFTHILPVFEARFYPIPLSCIIEINPSDFYIFLPGPISTKGEKHIEDLNKWLLEKRYGNFSLCWDAIEFSPENISKLPLLLFNLEQIITQKSLNPFKKLLLDEGKNIFYIDFNRGLCESCKENPRHSSKSSLCLICEKEIKFAEISSVPLFLDLSSVVREEKYFPEIIQESSGEELFTNTEKTEAIPVFYPSLPYPEEKRKKFCEHCKSKCLALSYSIPKKTCSFTCMSSLSKGMNRLSGGEIFFSLNTDSELECLYKNNFFLDIFAYLKSASIIKEFCKECHNKDLCSNELRCITFSRISSHSVWITGAWDKVINLTGLLIDKIHSSMIIQGEIVIFSGNDRFSSITRNQKPYDPDCIKIFGKSIKSSKLKNLIDFSLLLSEAIEKGDIGWPVIKSLYECKDFIESYFEKKDTQGLKFLPIITMAIKKYVFSSSYKEKMQILLELNEDKSLLPYVSFIISYLNLAMVQPATIR